MNKQLTLAVAAVSAAGLLASCAGKTETPATQPASTTSVASSTSPVQSETTSPSGSETPSANPSEVSDPTALKPGTNHNWAAEGYAYDAKLVNGWMAKGKAAKGFPKKKLVFLTFDDGPSATTTAKNLAIMKKYGVHATFFQVGREVANGDPRVPKRVIAEGHAIGIHSYGHNYTALYPGRYCSPERNVKDYEKARQALRKVVGAGYDTHVYRYPGGHMSWKSMSGCDQALAKKGVYWLDWNAMTGDADVQAPSTSQGAFEFVKRSMAEYGNPSVAVVLMHDAEGMELSTGALPQVISYYKSKGYEFAIVA